MGFLGSAFSGIAGFIDSIAKKLPGFHSDTGSLQESINTLNSCISGVNSFFPVDTLCTVIGLVLGIFIVLNVFYWFQRAINLVRGAG